VQALAECAHRGDGLFGDLARHAVLDLEHRALFEAETIRFKMPSI
jgi:hypothetical protein